MNHAVMNNQEATTQLLNEFPLAVKKKHNHQRACEGRTALF